MAEFRKQDYLEAKATIVPTRDKVNTPGIIGSSARDWFLGNLEAAIRNAKLAALRELRADVFVDGSWTESQIGKLERMDAGAFLDSLIGLKGYDIQIEENMKDLYGSLILQPKLKISALIPYGNQIIFEGGDTLTIGKEVARALFQEFIGGLVDFFKPETGCYAIIEYGGWAYGGWAIKVS